MLRGMNTQAENELLPSTVIFGVLKQDQSDMLIQSVTIFVDILHNPNAGVVVNRKHHSLLVSRKFPIGTFSLSIGPKDSVEVYT